MATKSHSNSTNSQDLCLGGNRGNKSGSLRRQNELHLAPSRSPPSDCQRLSGRKPRGRPTVFTTLYLHSTVCLPVHPFSSAQSISHPPRSTFLVLVLYARTRTPAHTHTHTRAHTQALLAGAATVSTRGTRGTFRIRVFAIQLRTTRTHKYTRSTITTA
jgi:hypothetical protein